MWGNSLQESLCAPDACLPYGLEPPSRGDKALRSHHNSAFVAILAMGLHEQPCRGTRVPVEERVKGGTLMKTVKALLCASDLLVSCTHLTPQTPYRHSQP